MSVPILEMKNINKSFSSVKVLNDVQLSIQPGEVHALMGENGAGKSTLMNILMGVHSADSGEIYLDGAKIVNSNPKEAMAKGISMIHQELNPVLDMDVSENIFLGREIKKGTSGILSIVNKKQMRHETQKLFDAVGIDIQPSALMRDLSVAQSQLVEIIKAISISARIIIMDEPTSAITEKEVDILFEQIRKLRESGVAIIYISHKMEEIFSIADSITVLRDGQFVSSDNASNLNKDKLIKLMVGRELTEIFPKTEAEIGEVVMEVNNYSFKPKVRNVNFNLRRGEILGIAGLVGAGRSELVEALFGVHKSAEGSLFINGQDVKIRQTGDAIKNKIALITEDRKQTGLNLIASIEDNITIVSLDKLFPRGVINRHKEDEVVDKSIVKFGVKAASKKNKVQSLSGGNQQKVVIAKWLLTDPQIIIMDEPTRGIDVGAKRDIYLLIGELVKAGKSVLMISSEIQEVMGVADRILVMAEGRITGELERKDFSQEKIMHYASQFNRGKEDEETE
ncbi:MAG: sugar ABC transporter ATP-binding protein [Spirochaetales bacterium]|uniref:Ribose/galactose/methyl galactoside import ATP-binding protein n=1 Tax=Candidatus Thalassospirochaeta sargassi TaxID=3119039 RepID=A0AAJ1IAZ9_9SPIO|nr:sugar ABC transporter ATP-binding protein [Spirochaetales bacterium]